MSQKSLREYLEKMRERYSLRSGKRARSALLEEFCAVSGHERKYAIKLLRGQRGVAGAARRQGRKAQYGEAEISVLKVIWEAAEQPCGKRLAAAVAVWLPHYERRHGELEAEVRRRVSEVSAAQIDRLLKPFKAKGRRRRHAHSLAALQAQVPVRTGPWEVKEPGWMEADTVAHGGATTAGSFLWSLVFTDIYSGWTSMRGVWNKGQAAVCEGAKAVEGGLPFALKGVDTDNGSEFLNHHLLTHWRNREPKIEVTRSRPYRKTDNAHIEQKNYTHVRALLGYDRLGHEALVGPVNRLYEAWEQLHNFFSPTLKLESKRREGSRVIKSYEKQPKTPCQRLLESEGMSPKSRAALRSRQAGLDPFLLAEIVEKALKQVAEVRKKLDLAEDDQEPPQRLVAAACVAAPLEPAARRSAFTSAAATRRPLQATMSAAKALH